MGYHGDESSILWVHMVVLAEILQAWKANLYSEIVSIPVKTVGASSVMEGIQCNQSVTRWLFGPSGSGAMLVPQQLVFADKQIASSKWW